MKRILLVAAVLLACQSVAIAEVPESELLKKRDIFDELTTALSPKITSGNANFYQKLLQKKLEAGLVGNHVVEVKCSSQVCGILIVSIEPSYLIWSFSKSGKIVDHGYSQ